MPRHAKKLTLLLILLISSSCKREFPKIAPQERCFNVLLEKVVIDDVAFYSGYCRCHSYEWTIDRIGRVGESQDYEMAKCDKLIGFTPDTYAKVNNWWNEIRLWLKRQQ